MLSHGLGDVIGVDWHGKSAFGFRRVSTSQGDLGSGFRPRIDPFVALGETAPTVRLQQ